MHEGVALDHFAGAPQSPPLLFHVRPALFMANDLYTHSTILFCEGEFDALLLAQEAGELAGIATFCGAVLGGYIVNFLPALFGYRLLSLFLIAGILRFCVAGLLFGKIKEVRSTEHISSRELFYSVVGLNPIIGARQDMRKERE